MAVPSGWPAPSKPSTTPDGARSLRVDAIGFATEDHVTESDVHDAICGPGCESGR